MKNSWPHLSRSLYLYCVFPLGYLSPHAYCIHVKRLANWQDESLNLNLSNKQKKSPLDSAPNSFGKATPTQSLPNFSQLQASFNSILSYHFYLNQHQWPKDHTHLWHLSTSLPQTPVPLSHLPSDQSVKTSSLPSQNPSQTVIHHWPAAPSWYFHSLASTCTSYFTWTC